MARAVKHWRHHPCKSLGGSSAYYQYHDTRILKFKQSEIIKKKILTYQIEKYCRLSLHWDTAELFECFWGRTYTQTTTLYLLLSVKFGNPIHEIPFWNRQTGNTLKKWKRLNKAFSERRQLGSTENHLFVYECCKMALCLRSLQRDIEWTLKH